MAKKIFVWNVTQLKNCKTWKVKNESCTNTTNEVKVNLYHLIEELPLNPALDINHYLVLTGLYGS
jgi:hypothetical protein